MNERLFLTAAIHRFLHPADPLPDLASTHWPALLELASAHAVVPMLAEVLPPPLYPPLQQAASALQRSSLAQSAELARLAGLLSSRNIRMIALKGPLLSRRLYGDVGIRTSGDIDILIHPQDVLITRNALLSAGYRLASTLHWSTDAATFRSRESEIVFNAPSEISVDLHWRSLPPYFASAMDGVDLWNSLETVELAGQSIQTLQPEALLIYLCAHGSKHMFERLAWICDIARFLMVSPDLNWEKIIRQAKAAGALRQVVLGVRVAQTVMGAPAVEQLPKDRGAECCWSSSTRGGQPARGTRHPLWNPRAIPCACCSPPAIASGISPERGFSRRKRSSWR